MVTFDEEKQGKKIEELLDKEAEDLAELIGGRHSLPYIDLSKVSINTDALRLIKEPLARDLKLAAFKLMGKTVHLATSGPTNEKLKEVVSDLENKGLSVILYTCSNNSLDRAWAFYQEISQSEKAEAGLIEISDERVNRFLTELKSLEDITKTMAQEVETSKKHGGISGILELVLSGSLITKASDIHFEPEEVGVRLRYRLDGVLKDIAQIDAHIYHQLLSRVKLISGLKLNVKLSAQDGRFSIKVSGDEIEIRTSIIPGAYGESAVMRILNPKSLAVTFDDLGVDEKLFQIFDREIKKPNGLILLTGPTGSGKTTTLYSFLKRVNTPETKIITIEDPIEYHLKGVSQTQVNRQKKYTFLSGLRAALRQDPDIVMVGEIRDAETARIAVNAALTGHLVFSTLHTNNAPGAIPRLIDLTVNPKILSSALTLSIAQRLVRKLCPDCKKSGSPTPEEKVMIEKVLVGIKQKRPDFSFNWQGEVWVAGGCDKCNHTGYKGRLGVFEAIMMDEAIANLITQNPSEREIKIAALPQAILDMREDGINKVINGVTSLDELSRVVDLYEQFVTPR